MTGLVAIVRFDGPPGPELARGVETSLPAPAAPPPPAPAPAPPPPACAIASVVPAARKAAASNAVNLVFIWSLRIGPPTVPSTADRRAGSRYRRSGAITLGVADPKFALPDDALAPPALVPLPVVDGDPLPLLLLLLPLLLLLLPPLPLDP